MANLEWFKCSAQCFKTILSGYWISVEMDLLSSVFKFGYRTWKNPVTGLLGIWKNPITGLLEIWENLDLVGTPDKIMNWTLDER
ncbi:hypothetical protein RIR_jg21985.t1 [Rhizophagus irregularis DAOM 181602=DAOM 197198]|nr:hypothetical protein RIR_jg21985.t1 [Rhizophagus irregularis DAOM 181602=DAOM 197198]